MYCVITHELQLSHNDHLTSACDALREWSYTGHGFVWRCIASLKGITTSVQRASAVVTVWCSIIPACHVSAAVLQALVLKQCCVDASDLASNATDVRRASHKHSSYGCYHECLSSIYSCDLLLEWASTRMYTSTGVISCTLLSCAPQGLA